MFSVDAKDPQSAAIYVYEIIFDYLYFFQDVYFPTVIVCNINQNRRSLFRGLGITNESRADLLYKQFYLGMNRNLTKDEQEFILNTATSEVNVFPHRYIKKAGRFSKTAKVFQASLHTAVYMLEILGNLFLLFQDTATCTYSIYIIS